MNLINLLTELASTPDHQNQLHGLFANQPDAIHHAFRSQNANALKQLLMSNKEDTFANERTVAQI